MFCGLDFGTSNCSIGSWHDEKIKLHRVEEENTMLPSCMFAIKKAMDAKPINENEVAKLTSQLLRDQRKEQATGRVLTESEIEKMVRSRLTRDSNMEALKRYRAQGIEGIKTTSEVHFGLDAINLHALHPEDGIFTKSPKSFLAAQLTSNHLNSFERIIALMLAHIKQKAEIETEDSLDSVVLGRPVTYSETATKHGNEQAIAIMQRAARKAGFKHVEFELEPIAASVDYERTLTKETCTLIVDIGGGTTDVTMAILSPHNQGLVDRSRLILASTGTRLGGNDLDIQLAYRKLTTHLGRTYWANNNTLVNKDNPIRSNDVYIDATHINNLHGTMAFIGGRYKGCIESALKCTSGDIYRQIKRLQVLHDNDHIYRFNRSAELAKILLSEKMEITLPLKYLEESLFIKVNQKDLEDAISAKSKILRDKIAECIRAAGKEPDSIFVTGGSSKSPILMRQLFSTEQLNKVVSGDSFLSVTHGLVLSARNRFG